MNFQISLVTSSKNGAIGIMGQCILLVYFIVGTFSRLLTWVMVYFRYQLNFQQSYS